MAAADELLATCWTTAGDAAPTRADWRSPVPLRERIEAAAAAGFTGFGVLAVDLATAEREHGLSGVRAMLADNGIVHVELEGLPDWWSSGPARARSDELRRFLLTAAEALGARHVKVTPDTSGARWEPGRWADEFTLLAGQAADAGARLGIEFLPWSNIRTVHDALRLVEEAGHPAGGLVVDVWHVERAGTPPDELAALPLRRIVGVELDDADGEVVGTLFEDTVDRRRYCGEGSFDLAGIITALRAAGWSGPWGVEILSTAHRRLAVREAAARAAATAREVVAAARVR
ncbi:sugar phosphate isomerase/epimerase [Geodermatophilus sp. YIM 151500]|uniref:sugar phosphate isomerase/epimerase family protein n=1 Tax=Geodermatophilus sp. YIM 151500 TaxID=2984531 RepID=UPI0021E4153C|nr:sugar phosphate isomerase/epimerase [Geodermatophilus sp. YIM 151500]MCV2490270.1 sugar phosphate isomerase/epimerase [Geodermatophilus sp. YIM 151500]